MDNNEITTTIQELRLRIDEPFLFVIVGEVKAGKSSFINALLSTDQEICAVAPEPKTDTIQQIKYGKNHDEITINPFLKQIRSEEHTSELQSRGHLVCRLLLEKKKNK